MSITIEEISVDSYPRTFPLNKPMQENQLATTITDSKTIEYVPFGAQDAIKLSVSLILNTIAVPTRTGKLPTEKDALKFLMLCRSRRLNPYDGDAFLVGYDSQDGPKFSLLTAQQVFLKRAEACPEFRGMTSGVVIEKNGEIIEREGDMTLKGETLLGGWAKVHRSDRDFPCYRRLKLETYSSGKSRWSADPAGMIVKCAEADALRSSFPNHLGGLISDTERATLERATDPKPIQQMPVIHVAPEPPAPLPAPAPKRTRAAKPEPPAPEPQPEQTPAPPADEVPMPHDQQPDTSAPTPREQLAIYIEESGFSEPHIMKALRTMHLAEKTAVALSQVSDENVAAIVSDFGTLTKTLQTMFQ